MTDADEPPTGHDTEVICGRTGLAVLLGVVAVLTVLDTAAGEPFVESVFAWLSP